MNFLAPYSLVKDKDFIVEKGGVRNRIKMLLNRWFIISGRDTGIKKGSFYKEPSIYKNYEKCRIEKAQMLHIYAFSLALPVSFENLKFVHCYSYSCIVRWQLLLISIAFPIETFFAINRCTFVCYFACLFASYFGTHLQCTFMMQ